MRILGVAAVLLPLAIQGCGDPEAAPEPYGPGIVHQTIGGEAGAPGTDTTSTEIDPQPVYELDDSLRIHEIQMKGSHNSYHLRPDNNDYPQWQYDMPPLKEQLEKWGVRAVELDLHYAPDGIRVYSEASGDPKSTCPTLKGCLAAMRRWSVANPGHHPLFIYLELKDEKDDAKFLDHMEDLEDELNRAWPHEDVIEPDQVVGDYADVKSAALAGAWPTLGEARGKAIFVLHESGDEPYRYAHNGSGLWGRRMFVSSTDGKWRHAGFVGMDTVLEQGADIRANVRKGLIVRTRTDNKPGNGGDLWKKRDAAFASGAQVLLTDYPADYALDDYSMNIPGGTPSRCNPLIAPAECYPEAIESPRLLQDYVPK